MGPTRIWKTLNGKNVKTNDGKNLGEIKKISENYLQLQKGKLHKQRFWIPKYVADAFDGKILWLLLSEEEIRGKYQYGKKIPTAEKYAKEFESFKGTPYGQKVNYGADFDENIRVVENYNNIRNLHIDTASENEAKYLKTFPDDSGLKPGPAQEQIHTQEVESAKGNERKNKLLEAERVDIIEYASKQPIKSASPKTIERPVQPFTTDSKATEPKGRGIKYVDSASSSPVRIPSSQMTSESFKKGTMEDGRKVSIHSDSASLSPVRIIPEAHLSMQSGATTPTMIAHSSATSSVSSQSPIRTSDEHKETVPKSSVLNLGSTKMEGKAGENILPSINTESTSMILATSTSIVSAKEIDKKPVLPEPMLMLAVVKANEEEEQIIPVPEKNREPNLLSLKTPPLASASFEETKSTSNNLTTTNSDQNSQLTFRDEGRTKTTESVNSVLDYYFNPFITSTTTWHAWLDMYDEFARNLAKLSLNWFDRLWNLLIPTSLEDG